MMEDAREEQEEISTWAHDRFAGIVLILIWIESIFAGCYPSNTLIGLFRSEA
ncbi:MAG: hypothetical protein PHT98_12975 [Kiritimatiellae bacterium]|jgi:hypothetical protein|nr:hypothetical protein [Kiritimatiellia bacterium]MDX9795138.1 hypothetical protein [Kiritimatiellia bacterium]